MVSFVSETGCWVFDWCNGDDLVKKKKRERRKKEKVTEKQRSYWTASRRRFNLQSEASVNICEKCHRRRRAHAPLTLCESHTLARWGCDHSADVTLFCGKENGLVVFQRRLSAAFVTFATSIDKIVDSIFFWPLSGGVNHSSDREFNQHRVRSKASLCLIQCDPLTQHLG